MSALKPCPFCGGANLQTDRFFPTAWNVCCDDRKGCGTIGPDAKTEAEAITAWNRRAPADDGEVERVARALAASDDEDYMEDWKRYDQRARAAIAVIRGDGE